MVRLPESITFRTLEPHEWPTYREVRLRSLADSPDAFGSTLAEEQARPADAWAARLSAAAVSGRDYPLIAELAGAVVGLVWARVDGTSAAVVKIFQVWVAPECRGRGIAATLMRKAIKWAQCRNAQVVQLGVTRGDTSAVRLYLREGFREVGSPEPLRPGSPLLSQPMQLTIDESVAA
jgi:ribosomal protein S18 acetylase RimI-like enzyme